MPGETSCGNKFVLCGRPLAIWWFSLVSHIMAAVTLKKVTLSSAIFFFFYKYKHQISLEFFFVKFFIIWKCVMWILQKELTPVAILPVSMPTALQMPANESKARKQTKRIWCQPPFLHHWHSPCHSSSTTQTKWLPWICCDNMVALFGNGHGVRRQNMLL